MQIVIDIPEEVYRDMKECIEHGWYQGASAAEFIFRGVGKGIPLPKNHGRLIDADELKKHKHHDERFYENVVAVVQIDWAETIIEASKGGREWLKRSDLKQKYI